MSSVPESRLRAEDRAAVRGNCDFGRVATVGSSWMSSSVTAQICSINGIGGLPGPAKHWIVMLLTASRQHPM
jgi:hypothetical protein